MKTLLEILQEVEVISIDHQLVTDFRIKDNDLLLFAGNFTFTKINLEKAKYMKSFKKWIAVDEHNIGRSIRAFLLTQIGEEE